MSYLIIILNLAFILVLAVALLLSQKPTDRVLIIWALVAKLTAGVGLGLVYKYYYSSGDTFELFHLAQDQAQMAIANPHSYFSFLWNDTTEDWKGAARSLFFVKLISIPAILSDGNYWITSVWLSFISFLASWYFFRACEDCLPESRTAAMISLFFFPSVLFWGSGVIKESIGLASVLVLAGLFLKAMKDKPLSTVEFIIGAMGIWIAWHLKYYWISVFLPISLAALIVHLLNRKFKLSGAASIMAWTALLFVLCAVASLIHPNFRLHRLASVIAENYQAYELQSQPENLIHYPFKGTSWMTIILNSPWAFVSGMFRPFMWEIDSAMKTIVGIENLLVFILMVMAFTRWRLLWQSENRLITLAAIAYCSVLCIFLALSTPNIGSLARYKVGYLPILLFVVLYQNPWVDKIHSRFMK